MAMDIYKAHEAAFGRTAAYVVCDSSGDRVATVAIKFPRDGYGRMYCYLHVIGLQMVRGSATGFGYDKRSAATEAAARQLDGAIKAGYREEAARGVMEHPFRRCYAVAECIRDALSTDSGLDWRDRLERGANGAGRTGLKVWQAC